MTAQARPVLLGLALLAAILPALAARAGDCAPDRLTFDKGAFTVEIADTAAEREQGLMNRPRLPASQGMLFVYDRPGHPQFWMKDTLIALDMLFIGADGTIRKIHPMAKPLDETPIDGGEGVQYVLEIQGGLAGRIGLKPGDALSWPGFGETARRPCR